MYICILCIYTKCIYGRCSHLLMSTRAQFSKTGFWAPLSRRLFATALASFLEPQSSRSDMQNLHQETRRIRGKENK